MENRLSAPVRDYVGRTVDLLAFDGAKAEGTAQLIPELAAPQQSGALITGISKLVQRFLIELLTEKGSLLYQPQRGTFFMIKLRLGAIRTSEQLISEFSEAEIDLRSSLILEESANDPPDEKYLSAELLSANLQGDSADLLIKITSRAGESRKVIYPLRVTTI
jgi:hypothetical protein